MKSLRAFALCAIAALSLCLTASSESSAQLHLKNQKAPEFNLRDLRGQKSILVNQPNKVVMLDFWNIRCGFCIKGMPDMIKISDKYRNRGLEFYAINVGDSYVEVQKFLKKRNRIWPVLFDRKGLVAKKYSVSGLPTVVLIDHTGIIRSVEVGYSKDKSALNYQIEILLNKMENAKNN